MLTSQLFDGRLDTAVVDAVIVGLYDCGQLSEAGKAIDDAVQGKISALFAQKDHLGELGQIVTLFQLQGVSAKRVMVVGLGKQKDFSASAYRKVISTVVKKVKASLNHVLVALTDCRVEGLTTEWHYQQAAEVALHAIFKSDQFRTEESAKKPLELTTITWLLGKQDNRAEAEKGLSIGRAIGRGVAVTRELGNLPANYCTPTFLAEQAKAIAAQYDFGAEVFDRAEIEALGMGAFLAVAKGSNEPPKFIVLRTEKATSTKPIVLVGKGITFDSGGISIKPSSGMEEMKYDMCGAATVLGVFKALGELDLGLNVVGIIPTCENMPSGGATRPGDVVTSLSGKTIEIINTDAEGRLILCDALTYSLRYDPKAIIDIATLTGACIIALGYHASGLMSNDDDLAQALLNAGQESFDRAWRLPVWPEFQEQIKGSFADIINSAGRDGGTITAACFLSCFVEKYPWAHLDIAGTANVSGKDKDATGRPVPLLISYLIQQAQNA